VAVELGGIVLDHLTRVSVRERARIVRHDVPGLDGELAQALGRLSVEVSLRGLFYGPSAVEELNRLRGAYLGQEPVDLFTESVGEGYFTQVLISRLEVSQCAGHLDQFDFVCDVTEYVESPEPVAADPLAALDAGLLDQAAAFVDDVQNGLEQVSELVDLLNVPAFGNPVEALPGMADDYTRIVTGSVDTLAGIRNLFSGTPG
jgi:hypothetical protein